MSNYKQAAFGGHNIHLPSPYRSDSVSGPLPPVQPPPMPDRPPRYPDQRYGNERSLQSSSFQIGQQVEVCLRADFWVVGFVLSAMHFIDRVTGRASYSIQYIKNPNRKMETDEFYVNDIRPFRQ